MPSVSKLGKTAIIIIAVLLFALIYHNIGYFSKKHSSLNTSGPAHSSKSDLEGGKLNHRSKADPEKRPKDARLNKIFSGDDHAIPLKSLDSYLSKNNRDPRSLVVALLLTEIRNQNAVEPTLIEELRRHPDSTIALAALAYKSPDVNERIAAALRLKELDRDSSSGEAFHMLAAIEAGKPSDVWASVEAIIAKGTVPDLYGSEIEGELREALLTTGMDNVEAEVFFVGTPRWTNPLKRQLLIAARSAFLDGFDSASEEEKAEKSGQVIGFFNFIAESPDFNIVADDYPAWSLERSVLRKLPNDLGYGSDLTVADRLAELDSKLSGIGTKDESVLEALRVAEPSRVDDIFPTT